MIFRRDKVQSNDAGVCFDQFVGEYRLRIDLLWVPCAQYLGQITHGYRAARAGVSALALIDHFCLGFHGIDLSDNVGSDFIQLSIVYALAQRRT